MMKRPQDQGLDLTTYYSTQGCSPLSAKCNPMLIGPNEKRGEWLPPKACREDTGDDQRSR